METAAALLLGVLKGCHGLDLKAVQANVLSCQSINDWVPNGHMQQTDFWAGCILRAEEFGASTHFIRKAEKNGSR